ncbi:hypothetical protein WA026_013712, partial [Henosepilachna vigintioctopunctata]
ELGKMVSKFSNLMEAKKKKHGSGHKSAFLDLKEINFVQYMTSSEMIKISYMDHDKSKKLSRFVKK